jgi:arylsulfatase A-like enzyme
MASHPASRPGSVLWSPLTVLTVAAGLGLAAGLVEAGTLAFRRMALHRILAFGTDFVWMAPLGEMLVFLAVALAVVAVSVLVRPLRRPGVVLALFGALAAFAPLLIVDQIHKAAAAVLALGIGIGLARAWAPRAEAVARSARRILPVALLALGLLSAAMIAQRMRPGGSESTTKATGPNVLLLVLDTVRAWDIGWLGYHRPTTPRLTRWVGEGAIFTRVLSTSPWTSPSHGSMFTGRLPPELSVNWDTPLDDRWPTLAEVMRDAGYATGGFVGNYRFAGSATGLDRGFEHYDDYPLTLEQVLRSAQLTARLFSLPSVVTALGSRRLLHGGADAGDVNRRFLRWIEHRSDRPFFAFINYFEAHTPYLPPAPWDSLFLRGSPDARDERHWDGIEQAYGPGPFPRQFLRETRNAYDGSIAYLDFQIDSLFTELERRGLLQNTVVIITSDHGEQFGEHGLIQHGSSLYLPVLHVPLAIRAPGLVPARSRVDQPTSLRHLAATILDLTGVPNPGLPGRSLEEYLRLGPERGRPDTLFAAVDYNRLLPKWPPNQPVLGGDLRAVVLDSLEYIVSRSGSREELYHLGRDSWQIRNLVGLPDFQAPLQAHRSAIRPILPSPSPTP